LLAGFALSDWYFGRGGGTGKVVILSQAYVLGRVTLRLIWEASAVKLVSSTPE
jgi:hypothetical protein